MEIVCLENVSNILIHVQRQCLSTCYISLNKGNVTLCFIQHFNQLNEEINLFSIEGGDGCKVSEFLEPSQVQHFTPILGLARLCLLATLRYSKNSKCLIYQISFLKNP